MNRRRLLAPALGVAALLVGAAIVLALPRLPDRGKGVPTAPVTKGPLKVTIHSVGELRAGRTVTMTTPPVGGMLRIVQMKTTGMLVKAGEVVMEFDPADQEYALEQARSELAEAEQEIVKMRADADVQKAQDDVALLTARFDVRRAELEVAANELKPAVEAQKNILSLEEARRRLAQLEQDVKSRVATNQAGLAVVLEKRNKATLGMQRAQQLIDSLVLKAPMDGTVAVKENRDGLNFFGPGMVIPEYREGDSVWPGRPVADVIESGKMEVRAKVAESDRTNLVAGQPATVYVDSLPDESFQVKVGTLSGLASRAQWYESATVTRLFDVAFQFDRPDPRLKAGSSVRVVIEGKEIQNALHVPRQAVLEKNGKTYVFVKTGERFDQREIKVENLTESRAVITGIAEGTEVALTDPTAARPANNNSSPTLPAAGSAR
jgi:HlyD family secretion protein